MIRNPAVAGQFYPESKTSLLREVESLIDSKAIKSDAIGVVSPHAGYVYSGSVAGSVFSSIKPKGNYVILGPNHTGLGERFGLDKGRAWKTPMADVRVNRVLADAIIDRSRNIKYDSLSHAHEHSIEVQLPFLQVLQEDFEFVPICVSYADLDAYILTGKAIAEAIKDVKLQKDTVIVASSDMTHYEPQEDARKKDSLAIEAILALDEKSLVDRVAEMGITMCGFAPVAIMLAAAKELGASSARLVRYQTSGDTSGDYSSVVGYAGIIVE
jgi:AmmeMemoRadiSam system protein B